MSHVTDVILIKGIHLGDNYPPELMKLNCYLIIDLKYKKGLKAALFTGGNKEMQCDVYMGAFNNLDIDDFLEVFDSIEWEEPECVQLLVKGEHEDLFTIYAVI